MSISTAAKMQVAPAIPSPIGGAWNGGGGPPHQQLPNDVSIQHQQQQQQQHPNAGRHHQPNYNAQTRGSQAYHRYQNQNIHSNGAGGAGFGNFRGQQQQPEATGEKSMQQQQQQRAYYDGFRPSGQSNNNGYGNNNRKAHYNSNNGNSNIGGHSGQPQAPSFAPQQSQQSSQQSSHNGPHTILQSQGIVVETRQDEERRHQQHAASAASGLPMQVGSESQDGRVFANTNANASAMARGSYPAVESSSSSQEQPQQQFATTTGYHNQMRVPVVGMPREQQSLTNNNNQKAVQSEMMMMTMMRPIAAESESLETATATAKPAGTAAYVLASPFAASATSESLATGCVASPASAVSSKQLQSRWQCSEELRVEAGNVATEFAKHFFNAVKEDPGSVMYCYATECISRWAMTETIPAIRSSTGSANASSRGASPPERQQQHSEAPEMGVKFRTGSNDQEVDNIVREVFAEKPSDPSAECLSSSVQCTRVKTVTGLPTASGGIFVQVTATMSMKGNREYDICHSAILEKDAGCYVIAQDILNLSKLPSMAERRPRKPKSTTSTTQGTTPPPMVVTTATATANVEPLPHLLLAQTNEPAVKPVVETESATLAESATVIKSTPTTAVDSVPAVQALPASPAVSGMAAVSPCPSTTESVRVEPAEEDSAPQVATSPSAAAVSETRNNNNNNRAHENVSGGGGGAPKRKGWGAVERPQSPNNNLREEATTGSGDAAKEQENQRAEGETNRRTQQQQQQRRNEKKSTEVSLSESRAAQQQQPKAVMQFAPDSYAARVCKNSGQNVRCSEQQAAPAAGYAVHNVTKQHPVAAVEKTTSEGGGSSQLGTHANEQRARKQLFVENISDYDDEQIRKAVSDTLKGAAVEGRVTDIRRMTRGTSGAIELDSEDCVTELLAKRFCIDGKEVTIVRAENQISHGSERRGRGGGGGYRGAWTERSRNSMDRGDFNNGNRNRRGGEGAGAPNRDGGNRDGGNRDGGNRDGGNRDGGNRDGGNRDGGNRDGGNRDGGNRDGGNGSGGARGGGGGYRPRNGDGMARRDGGNREPLNRDGGDRDARPGQSREGGGSGGGMGTSTRGGRSGFGYRGGRGGGGRGGGGVGSKEEAPRREAAKADEKPKTAIEA